jgi:hypothetical protein
MAGAKVPAFFIRFSGFLSMRCCPRRLIAGVRPADSEDHFDLHIDITSFSRQDKRQRANFRAGFLPDRNRDLSRFAVTKAEAGKLNEWLSDQHAGFICEWLADG